MHRTFVRSVPDVYAALRIRVRNKLLATVTPHKRIKLRKNLAAWEKLTTAKDLVNAVATKGFKELSTALDQAHASCRHEFKTKLAEDKFVAHVIDTWREQLAHELGD